MKTFFIAGLVILNAVVSGVNAQSPAAQWQSALGGTGEESAYAIAPTRDGGYIIAGSSNSTDGDLTGVPGHSQDDCWIVKVASNGNIEWRKKYGSSGIDLVNDIKQTLDGGYIFTGRNNAGDLEDGDVTTGSGGWLVKLSEAGNIEWQAVVGTTGRAVSQAADGGYFVGGSSFIAKYTPVGGRSWVVYFSHTINGIDATTDGGVITTGEATTINRTDVKIITLNSQGAVVADRELGTLGYEGGQSIMQTSDGGYIVAGYASGAGTDHVHGYKGGSDAWVVKLNSLLDTVWSRAIGGSNYDIGRKVIQVQGGYIIAGETGSTDGDISGYKGGAKDAWVFKLDDNGSLIWQKCLGGSSNDIFYGVCEGLNGGYVAAGHTYSNDGDISGAHGSADLWLVKLDGDQVLPVGFGELNAVLKDGILSVNWTTLSETNCDHFMVEASTDGQNFSAISKKIFTQAQNGNSVTPLQYRFSNTYTDIFGASAFLLLSLMRCRNRWQWKIIYSLSALWIFLAVACNKSSGDLLNVNNDDIFVRVVQTDIDGAQTYSKTIKVIKH